MQDDLISRDAVIDIIHRFFTEEVDKIPTKKTEDGEVYVIHKCQPLFEMNKAICKRIKGIPPVNPQEPKWIPVSERLPEKNMPCLVSTGKLCLTQIAIYSDLMGTIDHRIFYQGDYGHENFVDITQYVIAWMPLPKPYEPQESDDKCKNCKYYLNPDYTRCHECKAESEELSCCTKK